MKQSKFIEFLKTYDNFDKYVLFLLSLGYNVDRVAKATNVSRPTVYSIIERNKEMLSKYGEAIADVLEGK